MRNSVSQTITASDNRSTERSHVKSQIPTVFARAQLTPSKRNYGLSTGVYIGCVRRMPVTIMQAFAKVGKKDAKRTEARQKAAGEDEGSAEGDAEDTQENAFDEDLRTTQPPHHLFLHLQTEVLYLYNP